MGEDFTVTITNPERAEFFMNVFGRTTVHVKTPIPEMAELPGHGLCRVFKLDMEMLSAEEKRRLAAHLAEKFNVDKETVRTDLGDIGLPILDEDCTLVIKNLQRWF